MTFSRYLGISLWNSFEGNTVREWFDAQQAGEIPAHLRSLARGAYYAVMREDNRI